MKHNFDSLLFCELMIFSYLEMKIGIGYDSKCEQLTILSAQSIAIACAQCGPKKQTLQITKRSYFANLFI